MSKKGTRYFPATVLRVVDGDTYKCKLDLGFRITVTETFRLAEVDTPEIFRPRSAAEKRRGIAARDRVVALLAEHGPDVTLAVHGTGKYGRWISAVQLANGDDLGAILVAENLIKQR